MVYTTKFVVTLALLVQLNDYFICQRYQSEDGDVALLDINETNDVLFACVLENDILKAVNRIRSNSKGAN